jgi:formate-dependent nitrite reductase membrane component NrfD
MATVELIRGTRQTIWGKLAVANFVLGGLGAGLYVAATGFGSSAGLTAVSMLGPVLVLAGFAAVGLEAGRPLRGFRVLTQVRTSWMSRELWLGGAFVLLAIADFVQPALALRLLAVLAALVFSLAQGFILRATRGVPNWSVGLVPLVFLMSALVSGSGLLGLIGTIAGWPPSRFELASSVVLLVLGGLLWWRYVGMVRFAPTDATIVLLAGYLAPVGLDLVAMLLPDVAAPAAALAGVLMIGGQVQAKARLVLSAGELRPIRADRLRAPAM